MNYQEALAYIYSFSDFERGGVYTRNRDENLPREARLLELLGAPQKEYGSTLIAGTKGKGSTAAFIERVLREAGVRTGLYTQPDLHTFRERIRVDGRLIREEEVATLIPEIRQRVMEIEASGEFGPFITYEVGTALAFLYFARQQVQHAVVEVGLGGRLDATNVLAQMVSVITSISYDHMQILGNTLTEIATEKAGIIKTSGGVVVTSAQAPEAVLAIARICRQRENRLLRVGPAQGESTPAETDELPPLSYRYRLERREGEHQYFTVWTPQQVYRDLQIAMAGEHQIENATTALATLEMLRERGIFWDEASLHRGLLAVHWAARIEVVGREPTLVVDGAHNADSMEKLMRALQGSFSYHRLIIVLSVAQDKDLLGIVQALSTVDTVILTTMKSPRVASIEQLQSLFATYAPHVHLREAPHTEEALELAHDLADREDLICATGSLYLAGEALRWAAAHGDAKAAAEIEGVDH